MAAAASAPPLPGQLRVETDVWRSSSSFCANKFGAELYQSRDSVLSHHTPHPIPATAGPHGPGCARDPVIRRLITTQTLEEEESEIEEDGKEGDKQHVTEQSFSRLFVVLLSFSGTSRGLSTTELPWVLLRPFVMNEWFRKNESCYLLSEQASVNIMNGE